MVLSKYGFNCSPSNETSNEYLIPSAAVGKDTSNVVVSTPSANVTLAGILNTFSELLRTFIAAVTAPCDFSRATVTVILVGSVGSSS